MSVHTRGDISFPHPYMSEIWWNSAHKYSALWLYDRTISPFGKTAFAWSQTGQP
jgi:hypothetical protein